MKDKLTEAFDRGYTDYFSGHLLRDNPYHESTEKASFDAWEEGYWYASDDEDKMDK